MLRMGLKKRKKMDSFRHSPIMTRAVRVIDSDYDHRAN